jgi:3D (Asp-Asp-Asp) domain-containing protein
MRRFVTAIAFALLLAPAIFAREQTVLARVTVYWPCGDSRQQTAATGARLRAGHCAVDPDRIPYGSKVLFADGACIAVDTGPAVVSRKAARLAARTDSQRNAIVVDRFFETKERALAWASTHSHFMTLRIVTPVSREEQLPEHAVLLAQTNPTSTTVTGTNAATVETPAGLTDHTLAALLPLTPLLRAARRRP